MFSVRTEFQERGNDVAQQEGSAQHRPPELLSLRCRTFAAWALQYLLLVDKRNVMDPQLQGRFMRFVQPFQRLNVHDEFGASARAIDDQRRCSSAIRGLNRLSGLVVNGVRLIRISIQREFVYVLCDRFPATCTVKSADRPYSKISTCRILPASGKASSPCRE